MPNDRDAGWRAPQDAELTAARNFLLPRLDILGKYRWRGFGHGWMGPTDPNDPFNNALANLLSGQFQEWELGFEYSMPLGFRREYAAVRNAQFRVARETAILEEQERQAIHDLAAAFADADRAYNLNQVAQDRLAAAQDQYHRAFDAFFELGGKVSLELVPDARVRLAESESDFHRARVDYAVALKNVQFERGSLLEYNGAVLADAACEPGSAAGIAGKSIRPANRRILNYVMAKSRSNPVADNGSLASHMEQDKEPAGVVRAELLSEAIPADNGAEDRVTPATLITPVSEEIQIEPLPDVNQNLTAPMAVESKPILPQAGAQPIPGATTE